MLAFHATDSAGRSIYHTNVMMAVGTTVAVVCLESVEVGVGTFWGLIGRSVGAALNAVPHRHHAVTRAPIDRTRPSAPS